MNLLNNIISKIVWWKNNYQAVARSALSETSTKESPASMALETYNFWSKLLTNPVQTFALMGNEDGETSFIPGVVGDHGQAFGPFQWHQGRIDLIQQGTGIDIKTCSHWDQLYAAHWEMTQGSYKHVWPKLTSALTIQDAITVLVHDYEQSGSQARDVTRRTALAEKWQAQYQSKKV